jgi:esterase/lipase superfamily enzyme
MQREYHKWKSPSLGRDMEMLVFGNEGTPVIVFPTEIGRFFEWEDQGMIEKASYQIDNGYNQFFCIDTLAQESFLNKNTDPYVRLMRENQYQTYIIDEVLPFISKQNSNPFIIAAGYRLGAYQALNLALKNPESFDKVIALSGNFDINIYLDGFKDDNSYFNNPIEFIPNLNDQSILQQISSLDIRLLSYLNDGNLGATKKMSDILWMKFIEHKLYVWEEETSNPWSLLPSMFIENLV